MMRTLFYCFLFTLLSSTAWAQNVIFSLEASANTIGVDDQLQVAFTIQNVQNLQEIQRPNFPNFRVLAGPMQSESTNLSFNGNQQVRSTSKSFTYVLQATKTGTFTIPAIIAKDAAGNQYQCNSISIKVVDGSLAPKRPSRQQQSNDPFAGFDPFDDPFFGGSGGGDPFEAIRQQQARMQQLMQQLQQAQGGGMSQNLPEVSEKDLGKNVFIRVNVDKTKVCVGEQITATYKMYARIPMQATLSKLPSLNGFWTQDFELPKNQQPKLESLDGVEYQTFILKKSALFPQQTGVLTLDATEARGVARIANRTNPYGKEVQFNVKSAPVNINVSALPLDGQPDNFGAAVGHFTLNSSIDKTKLNTDETANLKLTISGTGNLKLIQAPTIVLPNGLDIFDPSILDTITSRSTTISGDKIITYTIAPRIAGDYEIPPIPFSFYNSQTKSYTTLYTKAIKLQVLAGKNYKKEDLAPDKTLVDIHNISNNTFKTTAPQASPLFFSGLYWSFYISPLIALFLFFFWKRKNEAEANNVGLFKNKYANRIALKRLKTAKVFLDKKETLPFYEEISKAIWLYLSDKLSIPLSQLSKETATEALTTKRIPKDLWEQTNRLLDDCETALYAANSAAQQMTNTYTDTVTLIGKLEDILKK